MSLSEKILAPGYTVLCILFCVCSWDSLGWTCFMFAIPLIPMWYYYIQCMRY